MAVITARFGGRCAACGGRIEAGDRIEWTKGCSSRHVTCGSKSAPALAPASKTSLPEHTHTRSEKWEPCRRPAFDEALASAVGRVIRADKPRMLSAVGDGAVPSDGAAYVVVGGRGVYESKEWNEDCGDMSGPGWRVTLYLRRASADEQSKSDQQAIVAALVAWGSALAQIGARQAEADIGALLASQEARVEVWSLPQGLVIASDQIYVSGQIGRSGHRSVSRLTLASGESVLCDSVYIYDWDQPYRLAGSASAVAYVEAAVAAQFVVGAFGEIGRRAS